MIIRRRHTSGVDIEDGLTGKVEVQDPPSTGLLGAMKSAFFSRPRPQPRRPYAPTQRKCNCPGRR